MEKLILCKTYFLKYKYIVACTAITMQQVNNSVMQLVSREWINKHIPAAMNMHTTKEEAMFSEGLTQGYIMRISYS
jgi:hypothetical protein